MNLNPSNLGANFSEDDGAAGAADDFLENGEFAECFPELSSYIIANRKKLFFKKKSNKRRK